MFENNIILREKLNMMKLSLDVECFIVNNKFFNWFECLVNFKMWKICNIFNKIKVLRLFIEVFKV